MSLSLSSISRTRGHAAAKYVIRAASATESTGYVVVTHRRISTSSASGVPTSNAGPSSRNGGAGGGGTAGSSSAREGGRLLRTSSTAGGSGQHFSGTPFFDPTLASSTASGTGTVRQFHNTAYTSHQQPPPPPSSSVSSSSSPSSDSTPFTHPHHPKHSLPPTSEGSLILSSHQHSDAGPSSHLTGPSGVPPTSSHNSSSSNNNLSNHATLFTNDRSTPFPNHALPSFFGAALSIARRSNLVFRNGAYGIPKVNPTLKGKERLAAEREIHEPEHPLSVGIGEDAYFLRTDSLGVADGVGGWSGHAGANPARWSRKLMHHCSAELARYENVDDELFLQYYEIDPVDVLQRAFEKTLSECKDEGVIGSSTALIAVLRNDELRLANMGDCCCAIIRGSDYIFRSEEQQHSFNFPFQAGTTSRDTPIKDAQRLFVKVQKDDIVILSSDGLCDNLFEEDVLEEVLRFVAASVPVPALSTPSRPGSRYTLNRFSPQALSESLCRRAKSVYEDQRAVTSPFQQRAMEEGIHFAGGKRDDITTLIGIVGELEASPDRR